MRTGKDKTKKEKRKYQCPYYGLKFERYVGSYSGVSKHSNVSSQIKCEGCGMFLKTWQEDQEVN